MCTRSRVASPLRVYAPLSFNVRYSAYASLDGHALKLSKWAWTPARHVSLHARGHPCNKLRQGHSKGKAAAPMPPRWRNARAVHSAEVRTSSKREHRIWLDQSARTRMRMRELCFFFFRFPKHLSFETHRQLQVPYKGTRLVMPCTQAYNCPSSATSDDPSSTWGVSLCDLHISR